MDEGKYTGLILLDLQKAFDTVNHGILLQKLSSIGMNTNATEWFNSYLSGRTQFVDLGGVHSKLNTISCGVPQGSILGPLLFLIYVNDMISVIGKECNLFLYADDSALAVTSKSLSFIEQTLTANMEALSEWLCINKLSLHLGKTECILFHSKRRIKDSQPLCITCNGVKLRTTKCIKYLGAYIDEAMTGTQMFEFSYRKISNTLKFLFRNKQFLDQKVKILLINSLVQPRFDYACNYWFRSIGKTNQDKLQRMQNKCLRFIFNLGNRTSIRVQHFIELQMLNVKDRVDYLSLCQLYNIEAGRSPVYLNNLTPTYQHNYNTRSSSSKRNFVPRVGSHAKDSFKNLDIFIPYMYICRWACKTV